MSERVWFEFENNIDFVRGNFEYVADVKQAIHRKLGQSLSASAVNLRLYIPPAVSSGMSPAALADCGGNATSQQQSHDDSLLELRGDMLCRSHGFDLMHLSPSASRENPTHLIVIANPKSASRHGSRPTSPAPPPSGGHQHFNPPHPPASNRYFTVGGGDNSDDGAADMSSVSAATAPLPVEHALHFGSPAAGAAAEHHHHQYANNSATVHRASSGSNPRGPLFFARNNTTSHTQQQQQQQQQKSSAPTTHGRSGSAPRTEPKIRLGIDVVAASDIDKVLGSLFIDVPSHLLRPAYVPRHPSPNVGGGSSSSAALHHQQVIQTHGRSGTTTSPQQMRPDGTRIRTIIGQVKEAVNKHVVVVESPSIPPTLVRVMAYDAEFSEFVLLTESSNAHISASFDSETGVQGRALVAVVDYPQPGEIPMMSPELRGGFIVSQPGLLAGGATFASSSGTTGNSRMPSSSRPPAPDPEDRRTYHHDDDQQAAPLPQQRDVTPPRNQTPTDSGRYYQPRGGAVASANTYADLAASAQRQPHPTAPSGSPVQVGSSQHQLTTTTAPPPAGGRPSYVSPRQIGQLQQQQQQQQQEIEVHSTTDSILAKLQGVMGQLSEERQRRVNAEHVISEREASIAEQIASARKDAADAARQGQSARLEYLNSQFLATQHELEETRMALNEMKRRDSTGAPNQQSKMLHEENTELRKLRAQNDAEIDALRSKRDMYESQLSNAAAHHDQAQKQIDDLRLQVSNLALDKAKLSAEIDEERRRKTSPEFNEAVSKKLAELQASNTELNEANTKKDARLVESDTKIKVAEVRADEAERQLNSFRQSWSQETVQKSQRIAELMAKLDAIDSGKADGADALLASRKEAQDAQNELTDVKQQLLDVTNQLTDEKKKSEEFANRVVSLSNAVAVSESQLLELRQKLEQQQQQKSSSSAQDTTNNKKQTAAATATDSSSNDVIDDGAAVTGGTSESELLFREKAEQLDRDYQRVVKERDDLKLKLAEAENAIKDAKNKNVSTAESLETKLLKAEADKKKFQFEADMNKARVTELEDERKSLASKLSDSEVNLLGDHAEKAMELQTAQSQVSSLEGEMQEMTAKLAKLQTDLSKYQAAAKASEQRAKDAEERAADVQAKLTAEQARKATIMSDDELDFDLDEDDKQQKKKSNKNESDNSNNNNEKIESLKEMLEKRDTENEDLRKQLDEVTSVASQKGSEADELAAAKKKADEEKARIAAELAELKAKQQQQQAQKTADEDDSDKSKELIEEQTAARKRAEEESADLSRQLEELKESFTSIRQRLQQRIDGLNSQLHDALTAAEEKDAEIKRLTQTLEDERDQHENTRRDFVSLSRRRGSVIEPSASTDNLTKQASGAADASNNNNSGQQQQQQEDSGASSQMDRVAAGSSREASVFYREHMGIAPSSAEASPTDTTAPPKSNSMQPTRQQQPPNESPGAKSEGLTSFGFSDSRATSEAPSFPETPVNEADDDAPRPSVAASGSYVVQASSVPPHEQQQQPKSGGESESDFLMTPASEPVTTSKTKAPAAQAAADLGSNFDVDESTPEVSEPAPRQHTAEADKAESESAFDLESTPAVSEPAPPAQPMTTQPQRPGTAAPTTGSRSNKAMESDSDFLLTPASEPAPAPVSARPSTAGAKIATASAVPTKAGAAATAAAAAGGQQSDSDFMLTPASEPTPPVVVTSSSSSAPGPLSMPPAAVTSPNTSKQAQQPVPKPPARDSAPNSPVAAPRTPTAEEAELDFDDELPTPKDKQVDTHEGTLPMPKSEEDNKKPSATAAPAATTSAAAGGDDDELLDFDDDTFTFDSGSKTSGRDKVAPPPPPARPPVVTATAAARRPADDDDDDDDDFDFSVDTGDAIAPAPKAAPVPAPPAASKAASVPLPAPPRSFQIAPADSDDDFSLDSSASSPSNGPSNQFAANVVSKAIAGNRR